MLRVGLTGDLGSGKSTVAKMLAARGAVVLSSDEMARAMMQPGESVYRAIVERFGEGVVAADGTLDRRELARLAFSEGRAEELNAIVHPAVLAEQARQVEAIGRDRPDAMVVIESALIFSSKHTQDQQPWSSRFDRIVLVTAPETQKVRRFVERAAAGRALSGQERADLEADARGRLSLQSGSSAHEAECLVIRNDDGLEALERQVDEVWGRLAGDRPDSDPVS